MATRGCAARSIRIPPPKPCYQCDMRAHLLLVAQNLRTSPSESSAAAPLVHMHALPSSSPLVRPLAFVGAAPHVSRSWESSMSKVTKGTASLLQEIWRRCLHARFRAEELRALVAHTDERVGASHAVVDARNPTRVRCFVKRHCLDSVLRIPGWGLASGDSRHAKAATLS